jgi:superfamily II DNA/RNA helicase
VQTFADLGVPTPLVTALTARGATEPFPVQAATLPDALAGRDLCGRAPTGSGKTLAFGIPIVAKLAGEKSRINRPRALIIVPTRELAGQVERSLELVARAVKLKLTTVYGGTRYDKQIQQLRQGTDIVVATPGRLRDLIDKGILQTDDVAITVLDEADHLCDLGFYPEVDELLSLTPEGGQRLLLSATLDGDVDKLVRKHLRDPRLHEVDASSASVTTMEHHVLTVGGFRDKVAAAVALVEANPRSIVFTRTREGAMELRDALSEHGVSAVDLHGNLSQRVRERNLERFSSGRAQAVVATDVAARGIHVDGVELVIHFDPPTDPKAYLHRSGRTARAGESGAVVTIVTPRQISGLAQMQRAAGVEARHHDVRTTPTPMTASALAESGTLEVPRAKTASGPRSGGYQGRKGPRQGGYAGRGNGRGNERGRDRGDERANAGRDDRRGSTNGRPQRDDRPQGAGRASGPDTRSGRPARTGRPGDRPLRPSGKKARWTQADRNTRG